MDFTAQFAAFPGAHQPYHPAFMPLTPSHSQSAGSDDFNNASPPQDAFAADPLSQPDNFAAFDYTQGFAAIHHHHHQQQQQSTPTFPGPPSPPNPAFGQHQKQGHPTRTPSTNGSINGAAGTNGLHGDIPPVSMHESMLEQGAEEPAMGRGGSEDDDALTPAQSRRKAQNRAAQRAFRERKEKHVKDLESKLASLEAAQKEAATENERLRRDLQKMSTENEILRATSALGVVAGGGPHSPDPLTTGPMTYKPTDFYSNVLQGHKNKFPSHRIVTSDDGQRLLAAGAAWDFIVSNDLYKRGLVDVSKVSEYMKHCAKCDGQGPVFSERDILFAIEQSVASGSDDLL